jgi:predicted Zn-dependent protease
LSELKRLTGRLMNRARDRGVAGIEVLLASQATLAVSSHHLQPQPAPTPHRSAQIRVYQAKGKVGVAHGRFDSEADLEPLLATALARAAVAEPDDLEAPPDRMDISERGLGIEDPRQATMEHAWREEVITTNENSCRSLGPNVVVGEFSYSEMVEERSFMSSRGVEALEASTLYRLKGSVRLVDRPDVDIVGEVVSRHFADVASVPLGTELGKRALALERTAKVPDRKVPIIFEPRAVAKLMPRIALAFDHHSVVNKKSFLHGRMGESIASDKLHLVDDATMPGALATRAFDDRGVPPMVLSLIREGHAAQEYLSPYHARQLNTRPTGHTHIDDTPWPGNLVIRPGARSRNMIHAELGPYLIVEDILNTAGIDPRSGRIDVPVRLALGELGQVLGFIGVRRINLPCEDVFKKIVEMGSDQERYGTVDACSWVLEGLTFEE